MKWNVFGMLLILAALVAAPLGIAAGWGHVTQKAQEKDEYRLEGPFTHGNLSVFLVHGRDKIKGSFLTLEEALIQKKVIVRETREVNQLTIQNRSTEEVYVQSGDIVKGGQQDRMIGVDLILPPRSGEISIAAFCVEHGRWSQRGNESSTSFNSSANSVASREVKLAAKLKSSQSEVWREVSVAQDKLTKNVGDVTRNDSPSSFQLTLENKNVQETTDDYMKDLSGILANRTDVIGYVFAINGKVNSADVYASSALFRKLWPKLLKASAIEAVAELRRDRKFAPPSTEEVRGLLDDSKGEEKQKDVTPRTQMISRESAGNVSFETRDRGRGDAVVHKNYIKKN
jgi:ARG/rhodanese/phosphatase superfamily protein